MGTAYQGNLWLHGSGASVKMLVLGQRSEDLSYTEINEACVCPIRSTQQETFGEELAKLQSRHQEPKRSSVMKLSPMASCMWVAGSTTHPCLMMKNIQSLSLEGFWP